MGSPKKAEAEAKSQRQAAKHEWKRLRKQQARHITTLLIGSVMGLEAVLMGMLSEWIFLAICSLLAFAALSSVRSVKGGGAVGAFVVGFSLYFTFLHTNTLLVIWPHKSDADEMVIDGVAHKWSHDIWLAYVIKNGIGAVLMILSTILGVAAIVSALKGSKKDTRVLSPRSSPHGAEPTQNVVIETYPPQAGPVLVQTAPLGQATLLQPAGVAYVTNVPPPPGVPYHTLNVADRPVVYQAAQTSPQFYTANPSHPTSPHFQPHVAERYAPPPPPPENVGGGQVPPPYNPGAPLPQAYALPPQGGAYYQA